MKINIDCKYYLGGKPCKFHKQDGRLCKNCQDYKKIKNKILIVKLDALGDVLRTTSILPGLKEKYPNSINTWITRRNALPLLENNPYIDRKLAVEKNYLEFILNEKFDIGICLDADFLSSTILSLAQCTDKYGFIANQAGQVIPVDKNANQWYLIGLNDSLKSNNRKSYHEIIYEIIRIDSNIKKPQLILDKESNEFANKFYFKNNLEMFKKLIGINTGGGNRWQLKKWTLNNYIKLLNLINVSYPDIGIVLFGGPEEIQFNKIIKSKMDNSIIDAGCNNSILEFAALINLVDIILTPDSLGMHISVALEKTTLVLVGPTSPWELEVFGNGEIIYNKDLDCIACYKSLCNKKENCMNTLTAELIFSKIKKYL